MIKKFKSVDTVWATRCCLLSFDYSPVFDEHGFDISEDHEKVEFSLDVEEMAELFLFQHQYVFYRSSKNGKYRIQVIDILNYGDWKFENNRVLFRIHRKYFKLA